MDSDGALYILYRPSNNGYSSGFYIFKLYKVVKIKYDNDIAVERALGLVWSSDEKDWVSLHSQNTWCSAPLHRLKILPFSYKDIKELLDQ